MISHSCKQMYSGVYFWTVELKAGNSWPNRLSDLKIMLCFWLDKYCHTVYMEKYNCANDNRIGNLVDWDENIEYRLDIPGYELCASIQFRQIFHILKKVGFFSLWVTYCVLLITSLKSMLANRLLPNVVPIETQMSKQRTSYREILLKY